MQLNLNDLEAAADDLVHAGWGYSDADVTFDGCEYARLELVLHESAHAASLGFPLDAATPEKVSAAIRKMDSGGSYTGWHSESALQEEALAWAVEWELIQRLGLSFEWGDVVDGAAVQGVEEWMVQGYVGQLRTLKLADEVLGWLTELVDEG